MEYTIKIQSDELVGRFINCESVYGRLFKGIIQAIIPAHTKPTKAQMTRLYGRGWEDKQCKGAFRAIKWDRVMFQNVFDGHHIVQPLNPEMRYTRWEIS
jgi:hypothetical protein